MKQVWLLTSGSYSDYSVEAACATEELANALCERENVVRQNDWRDELRVEPFPLLEEMPAPGQVVWVATVQLNDDHTILRQQIYSFPSNAWEEPEVGTFETPGGLNFTASGTNKQDVERQRAEWVAGKIQTSC